MIFRTSSKVSIFRGVNLQPAIRKYSSFSISSKDSNRTIAFRQTLEALRDNCSAHGISNYYQPLKKIFGRKFKLSKRVDLWERWNSRNHNKKKTGRICRFQPRHQSCLIPIIKERTRDERVNESKSLKRDGIRISRRNGAKSR